MRFNVLRSLLVLLGLAAALGHPALAQNYPAKPVKIIVPFAAGGQGDCHHRPAALGGAAGCAHAQRGRRAGL